MFGGVTFFAKNVAGYDNYENSTQKFSGVTTFAKMACYFCTYLLYAINVLK
jgi:hypothetical protein